MKEMIFIDSTNIFSKKGAFRYQILLQPSKANMFFEPIDVYSDMLKDAVEKTSARFVAAYNPKMIESINVINSTLQIVLLSKSELQLNRITHSLRAFVLYLLELPEFIKMESRGRLFNVISANLVSSEVNDGGKSKEMFAYGLEKSEEEGLDYQESITEGIPAAVFNRRTKTKNEASFVLVSLNMNYKCESFNLIHKLTSSDLKKFIEGLSDKAIENYVEKKYFDNLISDIGYVIDKNKLGNLKDIARKYGDIESGKRIYVGNFINIIKEKNSDNLYNELCEIFNTCHCIKKEITLRSFITCHESHMYYDLIACQEVTKNNFNRNLIANNNDDMNFAVNPGDEKGFYSDFLINKSLITDISFERISDKSNSLRDYIWKQVYDNYGFGYDDSCNEEFPSGYMSECYSEFNGTKIRVINFHRPLSANYTNRFLPFTLFILSYLNAIQKTYKDIGVILLGDFNGDQNKKGNKNFFIALNDELAVKEVIDKEKKSTHYCEGELYGQKLDHVFVSSLISEKFNLTLEINDSVNLFAPGENKEKAFTDHSALILTIEPK
ncbi:hypothetical protein LL037_18780 [Clostridium estertheticum]|uniref:hypothetical protein n=1 Tax=Clostridium estertheticum TaxID=238834 RepID=UPI001C0AE376|nr:hypothetical protein [Clostridium estertheticum]MBU3198515.1 hypothetical protein [Clostridium estertheticum]WAG64496.1 hypothetical protein LL037_18780 [Clostridium estertheticum]